jgi:hypothetical protein
MAQDDLMEKLVSLAKRRGYVFQSSEIYGGTGSVWDYGPLGVELKRNVKEAWWRSMVHERDDIEGLDASILMHPRVWEASGHVAEFTDPLVECRNCHRRFRVDILLAESGAEALEVARCLSCGVSGQWTEPRQFNLMFKTFMGPVEDDTSIVYLRPETAQGIYVNFLNVQTTARQRVPFGIAQIGKAFRNEITPGNFIFRTPSRPPRVPRPTARCPRRWPATCRSASRSTDDADRRTPSGGLPSVRDQETAVVLRAFGFLLLTSRGSRPIAVEIVTPVVHWADESAPTGRRPCG